MSLWVAESGEERGGLLVVLVHGSMDRSGSWVRVARELRDRHTLRYDRRGYGRSRDAGAGTLPQHVDDLFAVVAGRPCVLVGHSYGGAIALTAAERRPDVVRGLVVYESPMPWRAFWPRSSAGANAVNQVRDGVAVGDAAERFLVRHIGAERWRALPERTKAERRAEGEALIVELASAREDGAPYDPANIAVPVVSARGTESEPHLRESAEVLAAEVAGAELIPIVGADHGAHQSHPAAFAAITRRVLDRIPAP